MSDYVIQFADWCEFPPETMVGETVFDGEGNAIGWIVNATVGNPWEPSDAVIERIGRFCTDYAQCLVDATLHDKRPFDAVDHRTCESMEAVEDDLIRELAKDIVTVGARTCYKKWRRDGYGFCSECGYNITGGWANYCPNCGAKVVSK